MSKPDLAEILGILEKWDFSTDNGQEENYGPTNLKKLRIKILKISNVI